MATIKQLQAIATQLRKDSIQMTTRANSGHPTSCLSVAEIMAVLFFDHMRFDIKNPHNLDNDEFILSKGHAAPILYSALYRAGAIRDDLLSLRQYGSPLEGHPTPHTFPWAKVATGSLGQGLSVGIGMGLSYKLQNKENKVYVLCGDGETSEGSVFEALSFASYHKITNVVTIVDVNRFGLAGETMYGHNLKSYEQKFAAFGCMVISIDGHSIPQIHQALKRAQTSKKPVVIVAKTFKGRGVSFLENKPDWHGKVLSKEQEQIALEELGTVTLPKITIAKPQKTKWVTMPNHISINIPYAVGDMVATRSAYGEFLYQYAKQNPLAVAVDAEVKHSTFAETIEKVDKSRFIEAFIAEQNAVGVGIGLSTTNTKPFVSTFAAFFSRAHDQIRIAGMSQSQVVFVGSHAGVSIGEDGPTQMGLEDIALFRSLPKSTMVYPSDGVSTIKLLQQVSSQNGVSYVRTSRPKMPIIYKKNEEFKLGDFKVLKQSSQDSAVVVGCGVTVFEALRAHDILSKQGISVSVVDCYSISPFNAPKFNSFVHKHGGRVIVVEDHYKTGGVGEMISGVCSNVVDHLCVTQIPRSGEGLELLKKFGIDSQAIVKSVQKVVCKK